MTTGLRLVSRDGPVSVVFSPQLANDHFDELMDLVRTRPIKASSDDLRVLLEQAAERWGVTVVVSQPEKS